MQTLVLALNPSIDVEWRVDDAQWEEKNNVRSERRWAGGKGINVARWLKYLGEKPHLLLPLGGKAGDELAGCLRGEQLRASVVPLRQSTRVNIIVTTSAGRQMRFNPPGPIISAREWTSLFRTLRRELGRTGLLVLSGSVPRGLPVNVYATLISLAHCSGVRTLLDCDGAPFAAALKARPFLVKPNEHELSQWARRPLRSERPLVGAAAELSRKTGGWVFVSRGGRRSLLLNEPEGFRSFAVPRRVVTRNTVGAGDALLAAVARAIHAGSPPQDWLCRGLETGTRATQLAPGLLPRR